LEPHLPANGTIVLIEWRAAIYQILRKETTENPADV